MSSRRTRRDFLFQSSAGLGSVALSALLNQEQARAGVLSPHPAELGFELSDAVEGRAQCTDGRR